MWVTIIIGVLFGIARVWLGFNVEPESFEWAQAYKDAAHLFIGGLAVAWWFQRKWWQWNMFWALNAVEVVVAVWSRI